MEKIFFWSIVYLLPIFRIIYLIMRKTTFKIQQKRQSAVYFIEIYYISLFLTMIFSYIQSSYFWLWNNNEPIDNILNRFFVCYAIYQLMIIVKRKLNSSALVDDYQSVIHLLKTLILFKSTNNENAFKNTLMSFIENTTGQTSSMLSQSTQKKVIELSEIDFNEPNLLIKLELLLINYEHKKEIQSFHWIESFLLNNFK